LTAIRDDDRGQPTEISTAAAIEATQPGEIRRFADAVAAVGRASTSIGVDESGLQRRGRRQDQVADPAAAGSSRLRATLAAHRERAPGDPVVVVATTSAMTIASR
jgi:hypothetical protein